MDAPQAPDQAAPLRTVAFSMSVPAGVLERFRTEFPGVEFIAPNETPAPGGGHQIAPSELSPVQLAAADALVGWNLDRETLAAAPRLRWMHAAGAGVEQFDLQGLARRAVLLTNSSGVSAPNMAEHVLGMMLALARRFPTLVRAQSRRAWRDLETHREVAELQGQTVLVVGLGAVGRAVAERAAALGMRVLAVRRRQGERPPSVAALFDVGALPEALAEADHVVVALPNTPGTRGLIDAAAFAAMKPGAMIYNVGRGSAIDSAALTEALLSGRLGGAGLDVTDPEPLPADSPLWDKENVLITAHTSGATPRYWERQSALIAENIGRMQRGDPLRNLVDLEAGY